MFLAGSYAQLTLLGQPKSNSTLPTQTITRADYQNGQVQFRRQSLNRERSYGTHRCDSLQTIFDTKKTRDNYEKIYKQLEVFIDFLNFLKKKSYYFRY